ncbi:hypothetical protein B0H14DRAFT_2804930 [Mycena olivaceomarginata]|nr:hypothetical protein B0H14DRAFT_2804930 [Mycena olivaceomarginata]
MPPIRCESAVTNCHTDNISEYSALRPARNQLALYTVLVLCLVTQLVTGCRFFIRVCAPEGEGRGSLFNPHQTTTTFTFFVLRDRRHPTRLQSTRGKTPARAREAGGHGLGLCSFLFGFSPLSLIPTHPSRRSQSSRRSPGRREGTKSGNTSPHCRVHVLAAAGLLYILVHPLGYGYSAPRTAHNCPATAWWRRPPIPETRAHARHLTHLRLWTHEVGAYLPPRAHDSPHILQAAAAWAWGTSYDIPMHPLPCSDCPHTLARPESPCPLLRRFLGVVAARREQRQGARGW